MTMTKQRITCLADKDQNMGNKFMMWKGENEQGRQVTEGIYLYCLKAGEPAQNRKMILMK